MQNKTSCLQLPTAVPSFSTKRRHQKQKFHLLFCNNWKYFSYQHLTKINALFHGPTLTMNHHFRLDNMEEPENVILIDLASFSGQEVSLNITFYSKISFSNSNNLRLLLFLSFLAEITCSWFANCWLEFLFACLITGCYACLQTEGICATV